MRKIYSILLHSLFLASCSPELLKNRPYETSLKAEVTHEVPRDLSSYNRLFVPASLAKFFKGTSYFDNVMTHDQIDQLLDLEPNDTIIPSELSDALRKENLDNKYLVLEEIGVSGLRTDYRWNLTDPVNEELLFSSRIQINLLDFQEAFGAMKNSLIEYLDENSQTILDHAKEEQIETGLGYRLNSFMFIFDPSTTSTTQFGLGIGFFGEYRFSQPLAVELGLDYSVIVPIYKRDNSTMVFGMPLHLKWYLTNTFYIHAGPRLNYFLDPNIFGGIGLGDVLDENKVTWDMSFGLGFKLKDRATLKFGFAKGMSDLGKKARLYEQGEAVPLKYDTFTLGFGYKF